METEPQSKLTLERPDLWARALGLATGLTHYTYAPKVTIEACGGGGYGYYRPDKPYVPPKKTPEQERQEKIDELEREITEIRERIDDAKASIVEWEEEIGRARTDITDDEEYLREKQGELDKLRNQQVAAGDVPGPMVLVPEGAAEWLLHEVGHWLAATPSERLTPDYGCVPGLLTPEQGKHRELESWAFEVMVLERFGPARSFCPPEHSGGEAWKNALDPMHFRRIEAQLRAEGVDLEQWRQLYGEWASWYKGAQA